MTFLVLLSLILLLRLIGGSGPPGDERAVHDNYAIGMWVLAFVLFVILRAFQVPWPFIGIIGALVFIPSVVSLVFVRLGWVAPAYCLGRLAMMYFYRDPAAGAHYRGFQASQYIKDPHRRRRALTWLRNRFQGKRFKIYSGEMVMFVIIDAHLVRPGDEAFLARQLRCLKTVSKPSIPAPVSVLALKFALLPVLPGWNWRQIKSIAEQWDTPAYNLLAKFLFEAAWLRRENAPPSKMLRFLWLCNLRYYKLANTAIRRLNADDKIEARASRDALIAGLYTGHVEGEESQRSLAMRLLLNPGQGLLWRQRAQVLGVPNPDAAWQNLERTVLAHFRAHFRAGSSDHALDREADMNTWEERQKALGYLQSSIVTLQNSRQKVSGFEHFSIWMSLLTLLTDLKRDSGDDVLAFGSMSGSIWNWIAGLWNDHREYCLANFMARTCAPLARSLGHHEMYRRLNNDILNHGSR
ncbi:MAG: hypothetical protein QNJ40_10890 [Xanthomonadales bacterium]|nr:hypothetical protein [Xanthomonadales bacterium]